MSSPARRLLALAVGCVAALVAAEGAVRSHGCCPPPPTPPAAPPGYAHLYESWPPHGYRLVPSRTTHYRYPPEAPRRLTVRSNAAGFRDRRELDEADPRPRILLVGDSFVFGEGVEEHERFGDRLEGLRPEWRVDNLGMPGYGPDLMLRAVEEVGLSARPDVVVLCVYTDDLRRVRPFYAGVGYPLPRFRLAGGELTSLPYPERRVWHRSHLVQAARRAYWSRAGDFALTGAILDRLREVSAERGSRVAIVFLPGTADTAGDRRRRRWLAAWAEARDLPFSDLTRPIHAVSRADRHARDRVFIPGNPHLNPDGHRWVAELLLPLLDRLLPAAGSVPGESARGPRRDGGAG